MQRTYLKINDKTKSNAITGYSNSAERQGI